MIAEDRIDQLLDQWETLQDQGHTPTPEELCRDCPHLLEEFRRRLKAMQQMDGFLRGDEDRTLASGAVSGGDFEPAGPLGRYRPFQFHAAGGLGEILLAEDEELGRNVALKRVQSRFRYNADSRRRFVLEGEITGRLEHPGVVPVYGLGVDGDGNPYYAMRFIQGKSLRDAIEELHQPSTADMDPGASALALQKLLRSFLSACQTMAYAHQRGVIHRDLKPANIMLGDYGETLIVDWGLAKQLAHGESYAHRSEERVSPSKPNREQSAPQTILGEVKGSPAYMSPEQAAGRVDEVGPASDIYSLGATLYTLLTGRRPMEGKSLDEVLENVKQGRFRPVREIKPLVPRPLAAIAQQAMRTLTEDRYATAQQLADDLEHYFADEPVTAHRETIAERVFRWSRRHRAWTIGLAASLLAATLVSIGAAVVVDGFRRDAIQQRTVAQQEKTKAQNLAHQNEELAQAERQAKEQAEMVAEHLVRAFRRPDPEIDGRRVTVAQSLDATAVEVKNDPDLAPTLKAKLLDAIGRTYDGLGLFDSAVAAHQTAVALQQDVSGRDGEFTLEAQNNLSVAVQHAGRPQEAIERLEKIVEQLRRQDANEAVLLSAESNLGDSYRAAGEYDQAVEVLQEAVEQSRKSLGDDDPLTQSILNNLGAAYQSAGRSADARKLLQQAHRSAVERLGADHPDTLNAANNLAAALQRSGSFLQAIEMLEPALKAARQVWGDEHPRTLTLVNNLAESYRLAGRYAEAAPLLEQTLADRRRMLPPDHPHLLASMNNLSVAYHQLGRFTAAAALLEETVGAMTEVNGADHPNTLSARNNLGRAYMALGKLDVAIEHFQGTLKLRRDRLGPTHADTLVTRNNLAAAYQAAQRLEEAESVMAETLADFQKTVGPDHFQTLIAANNLAFVQLNRGRAKEATPLLEETHQKMVRGLGATHPLTLVNTKNLAAAYQGVGRYKESLKLCRQLTKHAEKNAPGSLTMAGALAAEASCLLEMKRLDEAEKTSRRSLAICEKLAPAGWEIANANNVLGGVLIEKKQYEQAEPLLLSAYQTLEEQALKLSGRADLHVKTAAARLVKLYEKSDQADKAEPWRSKAQTPP